MSGEDDDNLFKQGNHFLVEFAVDGERQMPARAFLDADHGPRHKRSCIRVVASVDRFADTRPGEFRDPARFKPVEGEIHEFRDDQVRVLCAYNGAGRLLLLDGVIKKKDDLRPADIKRAKRILAEHRSVQRH